MQFGPDLIAELDEAFANVGDARSCCWRVTDRASVRAPISSGCARRPGSPRRRTWQTRSRLRRVLQSIDECPAPVVCRVQGHAFGGAVGLVAVSDIAVAADDAVFSFSETKLGLVPAVISPFVLERIGPGQARRYFITGERFDALTALRIGLVHEVAADLDAAITDVLGELLTAGPDAVRAAKRLVLDAPLGDETADRIADRRASAEGQEGLRAFLEKRPPAWRSVDSS